MFFGQVMDILTIMIDGVLKSLCKTNVHTEEASTQHVISLAMHEQNWSQDTKYSFITCYMESDDTGRMKKLRHT